MIPDDPEIERLRWLAKDASMRAYAPYSHFPVGAAVLCDDGTSFAGCNVENASYGLTICAERNAVFQAVASGRRRIVAVAIYTATEAPSAPCGACRQVIAEFGSDAEVFSYTANGQRLRTSIRDLLPNAFGPDDLDG